MHDVLMFSSPKLRLEINMYEDEFDVFLPSDDETLQLGGWKFTYLDILYNKLNS